MVIGILSDTHLGGTESLEKLLAGPLAGADVIIHAGDHTGQAVEDHLEHVEPRPYYGVAGNCDVGRAGCALPIKRTIALDGVRIGILHGVSVTCGAEERLLGEFADGAGDWSDDGMGGPLDMLIFGHTHRPLIKWSGKTLIVNPGSPFQPRYDGPGTVALVRLEEGSLKPELVRL
jgi:putative phosphoesterase